MSVSKLCEALNDHGHSVEMLTTTANGKYELPVNPNQTTTVDGVTVTYFKRITKDHTHFSPSLFSRLRKKILHSISEEQHDLIIHIHSWWNLVSIFSCAIAKWYNIPVLLSPRGMLTHYTTDNRNSGMKAMIHNLMGKQLLKYCDIHATSEKEKQDVLQLIKPKSITVIPNLVDLPNEAFTVDERDLTFNLIFLSRVEQKKGLELLFDALVNLPFDWKLSIAGSGEVSYIEHLKEKADMLNLTGRIHWLGHVNNDDKFQLMAKNDLLVLTSYNENFANVVIESLSVGTAVLLSDQVGLADYVQQKELGWITKLESAEIEFNLKRAYHEKEVRIRIRKHGGQIIGKNFGAESLVKRYIDLYHNVIIAHNG